MECSDCGASSTISDFTKLQTTFRNSITSSNNTVSTLVFELSKDSISAEHLTATQTDWKNLVSMSEFHVNPSVRLDLLKYRLLTYPFVPIDSYDFKEDRSCGTEAKQQRYFGRALLAQFSSRLAYASYLKGPVCIYCIVSISIFIVVTRINYLRLHKIQWLFRRCSKSYKYMSVAQRRTAIRLRFTKPLRGSCMSNRQICSQQIVPIRNKLMPMILSSQL